MITFKGQEIKTNGAIPEVGDPAPDFTETNLKGEKKSLADFKGQPVLLSVLPDLSGETCQKQTLTFGKESKAGYQLVTATTNSADTVKAFLKKHDLTYLEVLVEAAEMGKAYGLYIEGKDILARSVFVLDADGKITYREIVEEMTETPDFEAALKAVHKLA